MSRAEERYHHEYRVTPARLWYPTVGYTFASAALVLRMVVEDAPVAATIPVGVLLAALLGWMFAALRGGATIVDERALTIQRTRLSGGNLVLNWSDVQGIEIEMSPGAGTRGSPRTMVVVYDSAGRRQFLPHLHDRSGLNLTQEVATLRGLWALGRGEDWLPDPETTAKIAYTRKHPMQLAIVALLGAIAAFLLGIAIFVVVLVSGGYADGGATVVSPPVLLGVLPGTAYVATLVIVGIRRCADRRRR